MRPPITAFKLDKYLRRPGHGHGGPPAGGELAAPALLSFPYKTAAVAAS